MVVDDEALDDFLDKVDEVNAAIRNLKEDKITLTEFEKKELELKKKQEMAELKKEQKQQQMERSRKNAEEEEHRRKWGFAGKWCPACRKEQPKDAEMCQFCQTRLEDPEVRKLKLLDKVELLKEERKKKAEARDRWKRWCSTQQYNRVGSAFTDYCKWDVFEPSDDEEDAELPPPPPPDTPEFKAMEKDIDDRNKARQERRVEAEKLRDEGNKAFKDKKFRKAADLYTEAISKEKSIKTFYTNRALAYLHLKQYDEAIADCTRVLDIAEFLDDNKGPGVTDVRIKALMRRANARHCLKQYKLALEDVELGLSLDRKCVELQRLKVGYEEDYRQSSIAEKLLKNIGKTAAKEEKIEETSEKSEETPEKSGVKIEEIVEEIVPGEGENVAMQPIVDRICALNFHRNELIKAVTVDSDSDSNSDDAGDDENSKLSRKKIVDGITEALNALDLTNEEHQILFREKGGLVSCLELLLCSKYVDKVSEELLVFVASMVQKACAHNVVNAKLLVAHRGGVVINKMIHLATLQQQVVEEDNNNNKVARLQQAAAEMLETLCVQHECIRRDLGAKPEIIQSILSTLSQASLDEDICKRLLTVITNLIFHDSGKMALKHCSSLAAVLTPLLSAPNRQVRKRSAKAIMNASTDPTQRAQFKSFSGLSKRLVTAMKAEIQVCNGQFEDEDQDGSGDDALLLLLLGIMQNLSLEEDLCVKLVEEHVILVIAAIFASSSSSSLSPTYISRLAALCSRLVKVDPATNIRIMRETCIFSHFVRIFKSSKRSTADDWNVVDHVTRIVATFASSDEECVKEVCDAGSGLAALVATLKAPTDTTVGNAALAITSCSTFGKAAETLGRLGCIEALLEHVKSKRGSTQKNCAIALAKLAKNEQNLQKLRDLHGIELLATCLR